MGRDILFLDNAVKIANVVYSIHKLETLDYVMGYLAGRGLKAEVLFRDVIPIPPLYPEHREKWHLVNIFVVRVQQLT